MRRAIRLVSRVALISVAVVAGALISPGAWAQDASPAAEESGPPPGLADETLAAGLVEALPETPAIILMQRVTISPGADIPSSAGDPGLTFMLVEGGELTVRMDAPLTVIRGTALAEALANPGTMPETEEIAADAELTLLSGDAVVFPPGMGGGLRNDGTEAVVLLTTQLFPTGE